MASLLNKYIGKYVANIDSSNLNVSVFKGTICCSSAITVACVGVNVMMMMMMQMGLMITD